MTDNAEERETIVRSFPKEYWDEFNKLNLEIDEIWSEQEETSKNLTKKLKEVAVKMQQLAEKYKKPL